jgi:hypothetical protein
MVRTVEPDPEPSAAAVEPITVSETRRAGQPKRTQDYLNCEGHELSDRFPKDVQQTNYVQKLVGMSSEQGTTFRDGVIEV